MEMALEVMPYSMACINVGLVTLQSQDLVLGDLQTAPNSAHNGVPRVGSPLLNDGVVFLAFPQVGGFRAVGGAVRMLHKTLLHSALCQKGKGCTQPRHRICAATSHPVPAPELCQTSPQSQINWSPCRKTKEKINSKALTGFPVTVSWTEARQLSPAPDMTWGMLRLRVVGCGMFVRWGCPGALCSRDKADLFPNTMLIWGLKAAPLFHRTLAGLAPRKPPPLPSDSALMLCSAFHLSFLRQLGSFFLIPPLLISCSILLHTPDWQLSLLLALLGNVSTPTWVWDTAYPSFSHHDFWSIIPSSSTLCVSQSVKTESFGVHMDIVGR